MSSPLDSQSRALIVRPKSNTVIPAYLGYMDRAALSLGNAADRLARKYMRWGPSNAARDILDILEILCRDDSGKEDRELLLRRLRGPFTGGDQPSQLLRACNRLMKYTLQEETAETQIVAFGNVVRFTTNYPGLRRFFLQYNDLERAQDTRTAIERLWSKKVSDDNPHRQKWEFFHEFAMTCILGANFALAVEGYSIDELGIVWKEDSYRILDDLLRTWITCEFDEIPGLVAMRYLGGILRLPSFWREENRNNHHQEFARKLFKRIRRFLEDVGFGREGPLGFTEHVSDIEGIDVVTLSALEGVNMWSQNCIGELNSECWVEEFRKAIDLLLTPEATTHLPHSSKLAIALFSEVDPKSSLANNPKSESAHVHQKNEMGEAEEIEAASLNTPEKMVNALPRIGVPSSRSPSDNDPKLESIHDHTDMHTDRHTDTLQLHTDDGLKIGREFTVDGTMNQQLLMPWKVAAVRSKTSGGWKAVKDIPAGCLILMEAPWLVLPSDYTSTQLSLALKSLNSDLAAFRQLPAPQVGYDRDITIFVFNAVKFTTNVGVFNVASRLSRSYRPNLFKYWNDDHQLLEYRACCDILAGEELLGPPFSSLTLLQPQKERCLLSSTWHTIQERSQCSYCDRTIDSTADMRRAALAGILLKNALSPRPHLRIHRLHEAIKWLEEENLSYFQADVCYMLHQAYESIQDLENSMLHLTKALDWSKTTIGEGDMRVKNLVQAIADLQMQMVD